MAGDENVERLFWAGEIYILQMPENMISWSMDIKVTSPKVVRQLMTQYGIAPLKKFGQNFLIDGNIADNIATAAVPDGACVLEIGPGLGALTTRLLGHAQHVAAYEIDAGLVRALGDILSGYDNFTLFHKDFLKADLDAELSPIFHDKDVYVAANLPYYITSPCIMRLVSAKLNIKRITVMLQKEVAQRICAPPGSKAYGAISAAIQYFARPEMLFSVSPACFFPKPDVHSAVMALHMQPCDMERAASYLRTVKVVFAMRRKTVVSNLRQGYGLSREAAQMVLEDTRIDLNARAETLSVNDLVRLNETIEKNI